MKIYEKIRLLRLEKNLSQENIASQLNISQPAYQKIECGKIEISTKKLLKLSEILQFNCYELLKKNNNVKVGIELD